MARLGGVEARAFIEVGGARVAGEPDPTRENTSPDGKASSVQFLRFPFAAAQIAAFKAPGARIMVGIAHPKYGHIAILSDDTRAELARDFSI
ncbi:hypothetical protein D3C83_94230 [compost metagenome]